VIAMQRKKYDAAFKARIALEMVKGMKTVNEIAADYGVHPNAIAKWKRQLIEGLPGIFSSGSATNGQEKQTEVLIASLYQKIGQLEVEREWLKKKSLMLHSR
jgi:transposase-like protein